MFKILMLYEEPAAYTYACLRALVEKYKIEVHLIRKPVNKDAPFSFDIPAGVVVYEQEEYIHSLKMLFNQLQPCAIYCAGWSTKAYIDFCVRLNNSVPVILGIDTPWSGSIRQRFASLLWQLYFSKFFTWCFVPGIRQVKYAGKLGFNHNQIMDGVYASDIEHFNLIHKATTETKHRRYPHRLLYAGRYATEKNIEMLWQAFLESGVAERGWELWCLGTGDIPPLQHKSIKHFGFVQPAEMQAYIAGAGVFVLPSKFEPWGVVVHEMAAAGLPLLLSREVGAAELFLKEGRNGYLFNPDSRQELTEAIKKITSLPDQELQAMSAYSNELAGAVTPEGWADKVYHMITSGN